jgi:hypothetical protein
MAHAPARKGESGADENMHQEEEDQIYIQLGMQISGLLQWQKDPIRPGVS